MGKKKKEDAPGGAPEWMVTFSDMTTLLLTFFILLVSMSTLDEEKAKLALGSLRGAMGVMEKAADVSSQKEAVFFPFQILKTAKTKAGTTTQKMIYDNIQGKIQEMGLMNKMSLGLDERGIIIRIPDDILFTSGNEKLSVSARLFISKLAGILKELPYDVIVEGHTDDLPIQSSRFRNNWDLAVQRSISVVEQLSSGGVPDPKLSAAGFGPFRPMVPNTSDSNRAKNRRIEIVLQESKLLSDPLTFPEERLSQ